MLYKEEKKMIAGIMQRLYQQKLTTASGGNVSLRMGDHILITPSQKDKGRLESDDILFLDMKGSRLDKTLKPSMETRMHIAVYEACHDIAAIVHAHPVIATAFVVTQKVLKTNITGETFAILGEPIIIPYALMGSQELAGLVAGGSKKSHVLLMQNHGAITTGKTLFEAYDKMEVLEACARLNLIAQILGNPKMLTKEETSAIEAILSQ